VKLAARPLQTNWQVCRTTFRQIRTLGLLVPDISFIIQPMTRRLGFIGFDNLTALDLIGPLEAFATANQCSGSTCYEMQVVSASGKPFRSEAGISLIAHSSFSDAPAFDTLLVPGGSGLRDPAIGQPVASFLKRRAAGTRRIASVCTGLFALADAGLMDGRRATTHWRFAGLIAGRFPRVVLDTDSIHLRDGKFFTSAGVTAGIDLSLALIAEDLGEKMSLMVARELVVYLKRAGGQAQYSEPLQFQARAGSGFSELAAWMLRNLRSDLSVGTLAARMNLGTRHFSRRFVANFGMPPAEYVSRLRLDEARMRLVSRRHTVEGIAASVGYASADVFSRAFERRFGVTPLAFRKGVRL
jgi:transcriptional regulator GlxA family with amidase domain